MSNNEKDPNSRTNMNLELNMRVETFGIRGSRRAKAQLLPLTPALSLRERVNTHARFRSLGLVLVAAGLVLHGASAADNQESGKAKEAKLIAIIQSEAPPQDKAVPCKQLAIYGTKEAVPALAALLPNADLSSWARIALEAIPDPAADEALREAMGKMQGRLLIGVINSIGFRRDAKAVSGLAKRLKDADVEVASAAAESLGHIGGSAATKALEQALASGPEQLRSFAAYGCIMCAERFLAEGKASEATRLYDKLRQMKLPKQRILEATRGAILARKSDGIPLLMEQLRSSDKALVGVGLGAARELTGPDVTKALVGELGQASLDKQVLLLQLLADRGDPSVLATVQKQAQSGLKDAKIMALSLLDHFAGLSSVPVLLQAATDADADVSTAAKATLARLGDKDVDNDLVARLPDSSGKNRQVLIELIGKRRLDAALPAVCKSAEDPDENVRRAAIETVGLMGGADQVGELSRLLAKTQAAKDRDELEKAIVAICTRAGAPCFAQVQTLAQNSDVAVRRVALHAFSATGGPDALGAVKNAINDSDEAVQDEAVRTLSNWPNNWPDDAGVGDALLALAKSGKKTSHQVQGVRGYLQYVQEDKKLNTDQKVAKIKDLLPLLQRPEEKRLTISAISTLPTAAALEALISLADDSAVTEETCLALVKVATGKEQKNTPADLRRKALQTAAEKSKNEGTKKQAEEGLKAIR